MVGERAHINLAQGFTHREQCVQLHGNNGGGLPQNLALVLQAKRRNVICLADYMISELP